MKPNKSPKDFVYFRSALPLGNYPDEAKPVAEALANRLRASSIAVDQIQRHWEDLRLVCRFRGQVFQLDLTTYVEAQPPEFSLEIQTSGRSYLAWFRRSQIRLLIEQIDQILRSDPAFAEIRWHRSGDLRKGTPGTEHPSK